jgi:hypothetical protein
LSACRTSQRRFHSAPPARGPNTVFTPFPLRLTPGLPIQFSLGLVNQHFLPYALIEATGMPFLIQVPLPPVRAIFPLRVFELRCNLYNTRRRKRRPRALRDEWSAVKVKRKRDDQENIHE